MSARVIRQWFGRTTTVATLVLVSLGTTVLHAGGPVPPSDLGCDPLAGTTDVAMAWVNNDAYAMIDITVDGTVVATLPVTV